MTTDDEFLNIDVSSKDIPKEEKEEIYRQKMKLMADTVLQRHNEDVNPIPHNTADVIEYRIMTLTTYRIYPNGQRSHPVSKSWFQDKYGTIVKKKDKKARKEPKKAVIKQEEAY